MEFEFLVLTAARGGEVRGVVWSEIDHDAGVWTIPANRMKAGREAPTYVRNRAGRILNRDLRCPRGPKRLQRRRSETHAGRVGQTRSDKIAIIPLEGTEREELHVDLYVMPVTNAG